MAIGDAMVAPTGVQNQMVGQPSRVPGYDQGYAQVPGMPRPTQPNPMGRPTAVVGGPAYFTPEGYNAPPQPTQAFMPTDRAPDPIGDQFMRQMQSPMGQQYQQQYEAIQAPIREAEMAQRAEEQAAQDARFQEMMDRIAELEGQVPGPTEPTAPIPGDVDPYIPGGPFPGIPDFIGDLDFSGLPGMGNIDIDAIIQEYQDRINAGEPEPFDSFLPDPNYVPPQSTMPDPAPAPIDLQAMLEDSAGRGRFYGDPMEPMMSPRYQIGAPMFNQSALDRLVAETEASNPGLKLGNPTPDPAPEPIFKKPAGNAMRQFNQRGLDRAIAEMGAVRK